MLLEARLCCPLRAYFCSKGRGAVRALVPCCAEYRNRALWHGAGGKQAGHTAFCALWQEATESMMQGVALVCLILVSSTYQVV